jgi:predicted CXXCH cytochrome family protein
LKQASVSRISDSLIKDVPQRTVLSHEQYLAEHTVLLKGLVAQATYDMSVIVEDLSGNKVREDFSGVVPAHVRNVKSNDMRPPAISKVRVGPIVKGIFLETTITWETDEPATSCVEYGLSDKYGQHTPEENALVRQHRVKIYELEREKDYQFRVGSSDMFGNENFSRGMAFDTGTISDIKENGAGERDNTGLAVKRTETFRVNSDLGLYVEASKHVRLTVEYLKVEDSFLEEPSQVQATTASEDAHIELRGGKELTIDVCYQCHSSGVLGVSHPVGVSAKETTRIPDDLPTLKGSIITCVTCHDVHGGSGRYFARRKITKEICISCHKGY